MESREARRRVARGLRERLEINRLFGWEVPLQRRAITPRRADPDAAAAAASRDRQESEESIEKRREVLLAQVRERVEACRACDLCRSRTRTVFGVGDAASRILFVGEGPGHDEDRQGEPFVGRAGQLLNDIIRAMGLKREQVYIANVVKCRPPQNRNPHPGEVGACLPFLMEQIAILEPEVIVALGGVAATTLLGREESMGRLRGRFHDVHGIPLMPTYHPAYLLRNPSEKRKVWHDIQLVMARLGLEIPARS